jgi:hypothetical protein
MAQRLSFSCKLVGYKDKEFVDVAGVSVGVPFPISAEDTELIHGLVTTVIKRASGEAIQAGNPAPIDLHQLRIALENHPPAEFKAFRNGRTLTIELPNFYPEA